MQYPNRLLEIEKGFAARFPELKPLIDYVLHNPKFALWSGCSNPKRHHYGIGGLQYHTWEVINFCNVNAAMVDICNEGKKDVDIKVLLLAALYHDVGKMWDYVPNIPSREISLQELQNLYSDSVSSYVEWGSATHKRTIHHISRSGIEWSKAVGTTGVGQDIEDEVLHCILSHHGMREWGSPVAPKSREAWLLFLCDGISARLNDADSFDMVGKVKNV